MIGNDMCDSPIDETRSQQIVISEILFDRLMLS